MTPKANFVAVKEGEFGTLTLMEDDKEVKSFFVRSIGQTSFCLDLSELTVSQRHRAHDKVDKFHFGVSGSAMIADNNSFEVIGDATTSGRTAVVSFEQITNVEEFEVRMREHAAKKRDEWNTKVRQESKSGSAPFRLWSDHTWNVSVGFSGGGNRPNWYVIILVAKDVLAQLVEAIESNRVKRLRLLIEMCWDVYMDRPHNDSSCEVNPVWYFRPHKLGETDICGDTRLSDLGHGALEWLEIERTHVALAEKPSRENDEVHRDAK